MSVNETIHVMLVDDDPVSLSIMEGVCTLAGFQVTSTTDNLEVVDSAVSLEPDVIVMDVMMPGLNGFEICRMIKDNPDTALIPVILATALNGRDNQLRGIEAGCDDFLTKPLDRVAMVARVKSLARVHKLTQNLDNAEKVLESLARSVEAKDGTTGDHCTRLTKMGSSFGAWLGLSAPEIRALERAGVLHDIGKIGIPDRVLLKPGKLDADEWKIMKTHTVIGAELLAPLRTMARVVPIVRNHHERWDGGGYPDGLKGEDIPRLARLFSIVDAFDALTNARPYKPAFSLEKTMSIFESERADGKWDPTSLDQFLSFLEANPAILDDLRSAEAQAVL
jgi:putative two-component system response regulator